MQSRLLGAGLAALLAVGLLASAGAADQPREPRLDELHPVRPAAALTLVREHELLTHFFRAVEAARVTEFFEAVAAAQERSQGSTGGDVGGFLACTRDVESNGDYGAVSSGGTYRGAYQFQQSTWDSTARSAGRPDLVGRDPATVSPGDQDSMATHLYDGGTGASHWGGRCH